MNFKILALLIHLFLYHLTYAEEVNYEKEFYFLVKSSPNLFQSSVNLHDEIQSLEIDMDVKSKLLDCALNEKHIYLNEYIPIFKKHLSVNELKDITTWLTSNSGKHWINFHKDNVNTKPVAQNQIEEINLFVDSTLMTKFEAATEESILVAHSAGIKFAANFGLSGQLFRYRPTV